MLEEDVERGDPFKLQAGVTRQILYHSADHIVLAVVHPNGFADHIFFGAEKFLCGAFGDHDGIQSGKSAFGIAFHKGEGEHTEDRQHALSSDEETFEHK